MSNIHTGIQPILPVSAAGDCVPALGAPTVSTASGVIDNTVGLSVIAGGPPDYQTDYITVRVSSVDPGASVTFHVFYRYTAGAAWTTRVATLTVLADASGDAYFYLSTDDVRPGAEEIEVQVFTTSTNPGSANVAFGGRNLVC